MGQELAFQEPEARPATFDVICAGPAFWSIAVPGRMRFRPGGGAVDAALALAEQSLRVGLATVLVDDRAGRALVEKLEGAGIDVHGVRLATSAQGIVFVEKTRGEAQVVPLRDEEHAIAIPSTWSSQVLLLSGVSPVVAHAGALCKAARAARRAGTAVVVDVNARWHLWAGRDARILQMLLREADVVWCTAEDLFGINMDERAMRRAMREDAVLAVRDGEGNACANGPFGEIAHPPMADDYSMPRSIAGAFPAAICAELAQVEKHGGGGARGTGSLALWDRALVRGQRARG